MIHGIGTDVVAVGRIEALLRSSPERFPERWFTQSERDYCAAKAHPAQHFAARMAAKEAVAKALRLPQDRNVPWRDIEVVRDDLGAPSLRLHGEIAGIAPSDAFWHVSLSHTSEQATATVLLESGRLAHERVATDGSSAQRTVELPPAVSQSLDELAMWSTSTGDRQLDAVRIAITLEDVADVALTDPRVRPEVLGDRQRTAELLATLVGGG